MDTETAYKFKDLDKRARERAIEWYRAGVTQDWEPEYDDFVTIFGYLGIELAQRDYKTVGGDTRYEPDIAYSIGFTQGDYAVFKGDWRADRMHFAELLAHAPTDPILQSVGARLMAVMMRYPRAHSRIGTSGNRYETVAIDTAYTGEENEDGEIELDEATFDELQGCVEVLASWIYTQLSEELLWQGSEENCIEGIEANDYDFNEDGRPL